MITPHIEVKNGNFLALDNQWKQQREALAKKDHLCVARG